MGDSRAVPDPMMADPATQHASAALHREGTRSKYPNDNFATARGWAQPVTYLGLAMLVAIYGILIFLIIGDRREAESTAIRQSENLVRIIDESFSHKFQSIDSSLLFIRKVYELNPDSFDISDWVQAASIRTDLAYNYIIADATGAVVQATQKPSPTTSREVIGLNIGDRAYFQRQAEAKYDTLDISEPIMLRGSGEQGLVLSRRFTGPDGKFAGIVVALVDPRELGRVAVGIDLGPNGAFGLTGLDGIVRSRVSGGTIDSSTTGRKFPTNLGALGHAARSRTGHFWNEPGVFDGARRLVSYRVLGSFPMIATASLTEDDVFRRSRAAERIYLLIALMLTVGILAAICWGILRERKLMATASALAQSQERYALVAAAVNDGIWDWNLVTDEIYRSARWKGILGFADSELSNDADAYKELIHPDERESVLNAVTDHFENDRLYDREFRMRHKDGTYRWVHSRGEALRDAEGKPVRMLGSITDITERKAAERKMAEDRANLARAEEMVGLGHYKYIKGDPAITWSQGNYRIMGRRPNNFTPTLKNVAGLFHPDERPRLIEHRRVVLSGERPPTLVLRVTRDDGTIAILNSWSTPIFDTDGAVIGYFGTSQDVTAKKKAETLIEESLRNLERAERLALLGHYKINSSTGELVWSDGIYRIFGLPQETFTPTLRSALELIHPDDRHIVKQFRDEAMAGRETPHAILRAFNASRSAIEIEYWSTPVRNDNGVITGVFGTVQDVTLRKRAETALARANTELEARVSERTAELAKEMRRREQAQSTLAQMQKMEVVGQLTAGIAHDFNNLLAVIGGSLEFVDGAAARGLTAEPELIDAALRATRRGRELVQRLLAFARQSPLRAEPTAIDQLVLDTLRLLRRTLGQGIDMVTHLDAKAAVISVDRNQLANALLNLALNARDAMPDGGQLTIATRTQSASTGRANDGPSPEEEVVIVVSDNGVGMTDDVRSRAFEPFFTTKPDGLGSGLGLSMVQGFVEQSGGQIYIDSGVNGGTTFTIRLPRIASASQDDVSDAVTGLTVQGREKTILLVEDDPDVRVVTAAQLKALGYKVHAVGDGLEAIDLIASPATIDITLTDIVLPGGLDGVELIKEAMRARPNMGVLCMSGYDPAQKHRKWLQIQNINFLEKPFSSSRLAQALSEALVH